MRNGRRKAATLHVSCSALCSAVRWETTGEHHSFRPGPVTRGLRFLFRALTPKAAVKKIALRMQAGMEQVEDLEKQHRWLKLHGSPLGVLGLPEHADLLEVKGRYRDLVLELHPDTAKQAAAAAAAAAAEQPSTSSEQALQSVAALQLEAQRRAEDFEKTQTAYKMLTDPNSLFYQSGSAPQLHNELGLALRKRSKHRDLLRVTRIRIFAFVCYAMLFALLMWVNIHWMEVWMLEVLRFVDPEFHKYFTEAEAEERRREALGEVVDKNPKRLAPTKVRKMMSPGLFVKRGDDDDDDD
jgi:hypothetical protein